MLQGYFRGLPAEIEEAGLMDGLSRLAVIWKITSAFVAAGARIGFALCLHDRMERISACLHAA